MNKENNDMELSDEALDMIPGGNGWDDAHSISRRCPVCNSDWEPVWQDKKLVCPNCGLLYGLNVPGILGAVLVPGSSDSGLLGQAD